MTIPLLLLAFLVCQVTGQDPTPTVGVIPATSCSNGRTPLSTCSATPSSIALCAPCPPGQTCAKDPCDNCAITCATEEALGAVTTTPPTGSVATDLPTTASMGETTSPASTPTSSSSSSAAAAGTTAGPDTASASATTATASTADSTTTIASTTTSPATTTTAVPTTTLPPTTTTAPPTTTTSPPTTTPAPTTTVAPTPPLPTVAPTVRPTASHNCLAASNTTARECPSDVGAGCGGPCQIGYTCRPDECNNCVPVCMQISEAASAISDQAPLVQHDSSDSSRIILSNDAIAILTVFVVMFFTIIIGLLVHAWRRVRGGAQAATETEMKETGAKRLKDEVHAPAASSTAV